jgi:hypothetical protein
MSATPNDPGVEQTEREEAPEQEAAGVEIGRTEGEGSTFEPEEDPEGHASSSP